jgi:arylsulfatase
VLLILLDDVGFGQFSAFGGGVPSPNIEKLAARGLRYTRFHTTALCSPTRAALLTGRDHHVAGTGVITELATGYDGYTGIIPKSAGTVAEIPEAERLRDRVDRKESQHAGLGDERRSVPSTTGREASASTTSTGSTRATRASSSRSSSRTRTACRARPIRAITVSHDLADHAIAWMHRAKEIDPDRPFFLYVAPSATHSPHMAPKEWIDKFKGQFDMGWDRYREATLERQKKLGVVPPTPGSRRGPRVCPPGAP